MSRLNLGKMAKVVAEHKQRDLALTGQGAAMGLVVVHAMITGDQNLVASSQPVGQIFRQPQIKLPGTVAILGRIETVLVPRIIDIHRVNQQQIRLKAAQ